MKKQRLAHIKNLFYKIPEDFTGNDEQLLKLIAKQIVKKVKAVGEWDFNSFMKDDSLTMARQFEILEPKIVVEYQSVIRWEEVEK